MFFETRLSHYLAKILCNLKEKIFTVQKALSLVLLSLFTGFLIGNLFGTFLDALRLYFIWNGFVGLLILLLIEAINSLVYGISFSKRYEYGNKDQSNFLKVPLRYCKIEDFNCVQEVAKSSIPHRLSYNEQLGNTASALPTTLLSVASQIETPNKVTNMKSQYSKEQDKEELSEAKYKRINKKFISLGFWLNRKSEKFIVTNVKHLLQGKKSVEEEKQVKSSPPIRGLKTQKVDSINVLKGPNISKKKAFFLHGIFADNVMHIERTVNSFKIGLLFGFFVDSFKVGS